MPNGFPPHSLKLKPNMPLMLLRNLDQKQGLCNGTKLVFLEVLDNKLLKCKLSNNKEVLIPRIVLRPKLGEYPFEWNRRQFPVKMAFASTINKSQGKTLQYTGIHSNRKVNKLHIICRNVAKIPGVCTWTTLCWS